MSSTSNSETLLYRINIEQTGATSADLDKLVKSITSLGTAVSKSGTTSGATSSLNSLDSVVKKVQSSVNGLNTSLGGLGGGKASAGLNQIKSSAEQVANTLLSTGRAADSYNAAQQKILSTAGPLANSMKQVTTNMDLYKAAVEGTVISTNQFIGGAERVIGVNTTMAKANMQAAESLSMEGRQAESAAASIRTLAATTDSAIGSQERLTAASETANVAQQKGTAFDKERGTQIMQNVRHVSGMALGFGVLAMSMDSVAGIGEMVEMQTEKVQQAQDKENTAIARFGKDSRQAIQAHEALVKAQRGLAYEQREATFALHNMMFMVGLVSIELLSNMLPAILKVIPKIKEMAAASSTLTSMKTTFADVAGSALNFASSLGLGSNKAKTAMKEVSIASESMGKGVINNLGTLGTAVATTLGAAMPAALGKLANAGKQFADDFERGPFSKYRSTLVEAAQVTKTSTGTMVTDTAAGLSQLLPLWMGGSKGPKQFVDDISRGPMKDYENIVGKATITTKNGMKDITGAFADAAMGAGGMSPFLKEAEKDVAKLGEGALQGATKTGILGTAFTGLSTIAKVGVVGAIVAVVAALVMYGTNAFGARDAVNAFGKSLGDTNPILKSLGDTLVGLAGVFGLTGESATQTANHFKKASQDMSTWWNDSIADMQASNDTLVSNLGNTVVKIDNQIATMGGHFEQQMKASASAWGEFTKALEQHDYKKAVDLIGQAFASLPGIFIQVNKDVNGLLTEIGKGIDQFGRDADAKFKTFLEGIGGQIQKNVQQNLAQFKAEFDGFAGVATEVWNRIVKILNLQPTIDNITRGVQTIINAFKGIVTGIGDLGKQIMDAILGYEKFDSMVQTWLNTNIYTPLGKVADGVVAQGQAIVKKLLGGDITKIVGEWIAGIAAPFNKAGEAIGNAFGLNKQGDQGNPPTTELPSRFSGAQQLPSQNPQQNIPQGPVPTNQLSTGVPSLDRNPLATSTKPAIQSPSAFNPNTFGGQYQFTADQGAVPPKQQSPQPGIYKNGVLQLTNSNDEKRAAEAQKKAAQNKPALVTDSNLQVSQGPAEKKLVPDLDEQGNQKLDAKGNPAFKEQLTQYGQIKKAVDANKDAIKEYDDMLTGHGDIMGEQIATNTLYEKGQTDQILKYKEMQAGIKVASGTIAEWGKQLNDTKYNNDLLTAGYQEGQQELLGWEEGVKKTTGSLQAHDAALTQSKTHAIAFQEGMNDQRKSFQDLQLGIDNASGRYKELGNEIKNEDAL